MSLADFHAAMEENDHEMTKEAEGLEKLAAEEDAAGRIMARGFMDEMNKIAELDKEAGPIDWVRKKLGIDQPATPKAVDTLKAGGAALKAAKKGTPATAGSGQPGLLAENVYGSRR